MLVGATITCYVIDVEMTMMLVMFFPDPLLERVLAVALLPFCVYCASCGLGGGGED